MKKWLLVIIFIFTFCNIAFSADIETIHLKEASPPNNTIFSVVREVIEEYKKDLQWKDQCEVEIDVTNGIIETNWHPVHKGELKRKIQIYVWGNIYRVDVWHRPSIGLFKNPAKGYMARLTEMHLQEKIEEKIK